MKFLNNYEIPQSHIETHPQILVLSFEDLRSPVLSWALGLYDLWAKAATPKFYYRNYSLYPRGSIYPTIMELGPKRPSLLWLWGPNSIMVVYMDPLGIVYKPVACIEPLYAEHPHYITLLLDRSLTVVEHDRTLIQAFRNYQSYPLGFLAITQAICSNILVSLST